MKADRGLRPTRNDIRLRLGAAGIWPSGDSYEQSLDRVALSYMLLCDEADRCYIALILRAIERGPPLEEGLQENAEDYWSLNEK